MDIDMNPEPNPEPKVSGLIKVEGWVEVINGDHYQKVKNHFVGNMLNALIDFFASGSGTIYTPAYSWATSTATSFIVLGSNTTGTTSITTNALLNPIGTAPGTTANTQSGSTALVAGGALVTLSAVWNAGTVSGTVGEIGLYLYIPTTVGGWQSVYSIAGPEFASRLSSGDGDFTSFVINAVNPLTINWTIQFTFG